MRFIDTIFSHVWDISQWFLMLYQDSSDIPGVGWLLSPVFFALHKSFWNMLDPIAHFYSWAYAVNEAINEVITSSTIFDLLRTWINYAEDAWFWIQNSGTMITNIIESWWTGVAGDILAWIDLANYNVRSLIGQVEASLGDLRSSWDNFWTITWPAHVADLANIRSSWDSFSSSILPDLATWAGSQALIETTLRAWFPFYDELVGYWSGIRDLFTDPEDYLVRKLESMLERFW